MKPTTTPQLDKLRQTQTLRKIVESTDLRKAATLMDELIAPLQKQADEQGQMLKLLSAPQPPKVSWQ